MSTHCRSARRRYWVPAPKLFPSWLVSTAKGMLRDARWWGMQTSVTSDLLRIGGELAWVSSAIMIGEIGLNAPCQIITHGRYHAGKGLGPAAGRTSPAGELRPLMEDHLSSGGFHAEECRPISVRGPLNSVRLWSCSRLDFTAKKKLRLTRIILSRFEGGIACRVTPLFMR